MPLELRRPHPPAAPVPKGDEPPGPSPGLSVALGAALVIGCGILAAHAVATAFLTDDAYIAFRYARNLAEGHGLVWNPGGDPVEGYTSLLWVVLLAAAHGLGASLEAAAPVLSGLATLGLVAALVLFLRGSLGSTRGTLAAALAVGLLALTRSFATWTTGGLETRLFEALVVSGVLRLLAEKRRWRRGERARPLAGLLLGLAALTRPEGLLLGGCALAGVFPREPAPGERGSWLRSALWFVLLALGHEAFRLAYHGDPLPNTWYAKVDGRTAFDTGALYLGAFLLELAAWSWIPLLVLGGRAFAYREEARVPGVLALVLLPYLFFVVATGGDHFEWRALDVVLPFAFLLIGVGAVELGARGIPAAAGAGALVALVALGLLDLPLRVRATFPPEEEGYVAGFPGLATATQATGFLAPEGTVLHALPGLDALARRHRAWLFALTARFVGLRREEHARFRRVVEAEAARLERLVAGGHLARDTYVALDCVGVIGYRTDLRVFDRLGLTNREVAHGPVVRPDLQAHPKYATPEQAEEAGVELWAVEGLQLAFDAWDARLPRLLRELRGTPALFAHVPEEELFLVIWPPCGRPAPERTPGIAWKSVDDEEAVSDARLVIATAIEARL